MRVFAFVVAALYNVLYHSELDSGDDVREDGIDTKEMRRGWCSRFGLDIVGVNDGNVIIDKRVY